MRQPQIRLQQSIVDEEEKYTNKGPIKERRYFIDKRGFRYFSSQRNFSKGEDEGREENVVNDAVSSLLEMMVASQVSPICTKR